MKVDDQLYDIRFAVNDFGDAVFSIYDKFNALNQILQMMNTILSNISSDLVKKRVTLTFVDGKAALPADYGGMVSLAGSSGSRMYERISEDTSDLNTYEILDNEVYTAHDSLVLTYKKTFAEFATTDTDEDMPVPDMFKPVITSYAKTLLTQAKSFDSEMISQLEADVKRRTSSRTNKAFRYAWTT